MVFRQEGESSISIGEGTFWSMMSGAIPESFQHDGDKSSNDPIFFGQKFGTLVVELDGDGEVLTTRTPGIPVNHPTLVGCFADVMDSVDHCLDRWGRRLAHGAIVLVARMAPSTCWSKRESRSTPMRR